MKNAGRRRNVITSYILGLVLWYLITSGRQYKVYPIFGLVPTSVNVWVEYGLDVMYLVCSHGNVDSLRLKW